MLSDTHQARASLGAHLKKSEGPRTKGLNWFPNSERTRELGELQNFQGQFEALNSRHFGVSLEYVSRRASLRLAASQRRVAFELI